MSRKGGDKPVQKDLSENMAATHCLSHMITECKKLFQVATFSLIMSVDNSVSASIAGKIFQVFLHILYTLTVARIYFGNRVRHIFALISFLSLFVSADPS